MGQNYWWVDGVSSGAWSNPANWYTYVNNTKVTPAGPPGAGDGVSIGVNQFVSEVDTGGASAGVVDCYGNLSGGLTADEIDGAAGQATMPNFLTLAPITTLSNGAYVASTTIGYWIAGSGVSIQANNISFIINNGALVTAAGSAEGIYITAGMLQVGSLDQATIDGGTVTVAQAITTAFLNGGTTQAQAAQNVTVNQGSFTVSSAIQSSTLNGGTVQVNSLGFSTVNGGNVTITTTVDDCTFDGGNVSVGQFIDGNTINGSVVTAGDIGSGNFQGLTIVSGSLTAGALNFQNLSFVGVEMHGGTLNAASLTIGGSGFGFFEINGGAQATINGPTRLAAGFFNVGIDTVSFSGATGGTLDLQGGLTVANDTFQVASGGITNVTGDVVVDEQNGLASNSGIVITALGSLLTVSGQLLLGQTQQANLSITNGGDAAAQTVFVGSSIAGSRGQAEVDGLGSELKASSLTVGGAMPTATNSNGDPNGTDGLWRYIGGVGNVSLTNGASVVVNQTITLQGGTITDFSGSSVEIGGNQGAPSGTLLIDASGKLVGNGAVTVMTSFSNDIGVITHGIIVMHSGIINNGLIDATEGTLALSGDVSGNGTAHIDANSTLILSGAFAKGGTVSFGTDTSTLELEQPSQFNGLLEDMVPGDKIVLDNTSLQNGNAVLAATIGQLNGVQTLEIDEGPTTNIQQSTPQLECPIQGPNNTDLRGQYFQVSKNGQNTILTLTEGNPIDLAVNGPAARALGADGAGITIGIISTSFNALGGMANDISEGALPSSINILQDGASNDEGRAMAQIIHAIAPDANIDFYGLGNPGAVTFTSSNMAYAINRLQAAGCQVIVDDLGLGLSDPTVGGTINAAINAAVQAGITYVTAAGNSGNGVPIPDHAANPFALTVGAVNLLASPSSVGGYLPPESEVYSQASPGKPEVSGPVGGPTTLPLPTLSGQHDPFFGTSAAAPAAAAVAALALEADPQLTPNQVKQIIEGSAVQFGNSAISGAGLVQADGTVAAALSALNPFFHGSSSASLSNDETTDISNSQTGPIVVSAFLSQPSGDVNSGSVLKIVLSMNEGVMVTGGNPSFTLNDGAVASYDPASSTPSIGNLVFDYAVGANDHTSNLAVTGVNLNGATVQDTSTNNADFSALSNIPIGVSINSPLVVIGVAASQTGEVQVGQTVQLTLTMNEAVVVNTAGGPPTVNLSNDATGTYDASASQPSAGKLVFDYTVADADAIPNLAVFAVDLPSGTTIQDAGGNNADFSGQALFQNTGLQVGSAFVNSFYASQSGTGHTGQTVQLTLAMSAAVTVNISGGSPTLSLNDGAAATYDAQVSNPATGTLVFDYTVGSNDQTSDLLVTQVNPNGAIIHDGNGVSVDMSGAVGFPTELSINSPLVVTAVAASQTGQVLAGQTVQLTLTLNEAVQDNSVDNVYGPPTLTLNDGGTAYYDAAASNPSSNNVVFDYTVGAGEHTPNLAIIQANLNGEDIADSNGNLPDFSAALNVPTNLQVVSVPLPTASTDLYITPAAIALTVPAASGVLANDTDPNGLTLSASLDQTTSHGTLTLNTDGSFSYTPNAGFVGTDSFTYTASDADLSSAPTTASIVVGSLNALTSPEQLLTELYVGYYDRAPDVPGLNYWLNNYNTPPAQSPGGVNLFYQNLGQAAASFADPHQTETVTLYPFLADPQAANYSDVVTFVDAAYGNLFNRTADTLGEEYWATSIAKSLGIAVPTFGIAGIDNDLPVTAANALLALINGAVSNDAQTIANKVTAGLYYYDLLAANNVAATQASAHAAFAGVTDDPATVLASEAVTNAFVQAALHPSAASAALATVGILDSAQSFQAAA